MLQNIFLDVLETTQWKKVLDAQAVCTANTFDSTILANVTKTLNTSELGKAVTWFNEHIRAEQLTMIQGFYIS